MSDKVFIIIVFYNPSSEDIAAASHLAERWLGAIIDNSPQPCFDGDKWGRMIYRYNNENLGIAAAQNIGIEEALKTDGVEMIVFLDQDSRVPIEYPALIVEEFNIVCRDITNLAMLGPTVIYTTCVPSHRSRQGRQMQAQRTLTRRQPIYKACQYFSLRLPTQGFTSEEFVMPSYIRGHFVFN